MRKQSQCPNGLGKNSYSRIVVLALLAGVRLGVAGLSLLLFCLLPISAHATTGTLTINADTTLTEDHIGNIVIAADFVTLDCDGHDVTGLGTGSGIDLTGRTGVTVEKCHVTNFRTGFFLFDASGNELKENSATVNGGIGFFLEDGASGNKLQENTTTGGGTGFFLERVSNNTLERNTATGNTMGFVLVNAFDSKLADNTATANSDGFVLSGESWGNKLEGNTVIDNVGDGFSLTERSSDNTLQGNTANNNTNIGFLVDVGTFNNFLEENEACDNLVVDARQEMPSSNVYEKNDFCTTDGI